MTWCLFFLWLSQAAPAGEMYYGRWGYAPTNSRAAGSRALDLEARPGVPDLYAARIMVPASKEFEVGVCLRTIEDGELEAVVLEDGTFRVLGQSPLADPRPTPNYSWITAKVRLDQGLAAGRYWFGVRVKASGRYLVPLDREPEGATEPGWSSFLSSGSVPGGLRVTYGRHEFGPDPMIRVREARPAVDPPEALFDYSPQRIRVGEEVTFSDESQTPSGASIIRRTWRLGDGDLAHEEKVKHAYDFPGAKQVSLRIVDANGLASTHEETIIVEPLAFGASGAGPITSFSQGLISRLPGRQEKFSMSFDPASRPGAVEFILEDQEGRQVGLAPAVEIPGTSTYEASFAEEELMVASRVSARVDGSVQTGPYVLNVEQPCPLPEWYYYGTLSGSKPKPYDQITDVTYEMQDQGIMVLRGFIPRDLLETTTDFIIPMVGTLPNLFGGGVWIEEWYVPATEMYRINLFGLTQADIFGIGLYEHHYTIDTSESNLRSCWDSYDLDPQWSLAEVLISPVTIPLGGFVIPVYLMVLEFDISVSTFLTVGADVLMEGDMSFAGEGLGVDLIRIMPEISAGIDIIAQLNIFLGVISTGMVVTGLADFGWPHTYDGNSVDSSFCFELACKIKFFLSLFWGIFDDIETQEFELFDYCTPEGGPCCDGGGGAQVEPGDRRLLWPLSVAADSDGRYAISVWIEDHDPGAEFDPEVYFSVRSRDQWPGGKPIGPSDFYKTNPDVAVFSVDPPLAMAVWTQNSIPKSESGNITDFETAVEGQDIWYAIFNFSTGEWTAPAPVMEDRAGAHIADGIPSVAGAPASAGGGTAAVAWTRYSSAGIVRWVTDTRAVPDLGKTEIYCRSCTQPVEGKPSWSAVERVTDDDLPDMCPAVAVSAAGHLGMAWITQRDAAQGGLLNDGNRQVRCALKDTRWRFLTLETGRRGASSPDVSLRSKDELVVAYTQWPDSTGIPEEKQGRLGADELGLSVIPAGFNAADVWHVPVKGPRFAQDPKILAASGKGMTIVCRGFEDGGPRAAKPFFVGVPTSPVDFAEAHKADFTDRSFLSVTGAHLGSDIILLGRTTSSAEGGGASTGPGGTEESSAPALADLRVSVAALLEVDADGTSYMAWSMIGNNGPRPSILHEFQVKFWLNGDLLDAGTYNPSSCWNSTVIQCQDIIPYTGGVLRLRVEVLPHPDDDSDPLNNEYTYELCTWDCPVEPLHSVAQGVGTTASWSGSEEVDAWRIFRDGRLAGEIQCDVDRLQRRPPRDLIEWMDCQAPSGAHTWRIEGLVAGQMVASGEGSAEVEGPGLHLGSVWPPEIPAGESSSITIKGLGFTSETTATIGSLSLNGLVVVDSKTIVGLAPAQPAGSPTVEVCRSAGDCVSSSGLVKYVGPEDEFRRSGANADGKVDLSDGVYTLNWLFLGSKEPTCLDAVDANDDGATNMSDAIFTFNWLFLGGPAPPDPGTRACGPDRKADSLAACRYDRC